MPAEPSELEKQLVDASKKNSSEVLQILKNNENIVTAEFANRTISYAGNRGWGGESGGTLNLLFFSLKSDSKELKDFLLAKGADINWVDKLGNTRLHNVASNTDLSDMQFLLDNGANINQAGYNGNTPLHYAINAVIVRQNCHLFWSNDKLQAVKLLLERFADVNMPNNGNITPLDSAINDKDLQALLNEYNPAHNIKDGNEEEASASLSCVV